MLRCEGDGAPVRAANKPRSQEKKGGVCVVSYCLWLSAPTALKWRPISLLDRGVKMHANERAFREVKDGQYSANRCFVPGATPWQHLSFFGLFMRWVWHLLALADAGSAMCNARRGLSVETFLVSNLPIKGLLHDMRLNPPKTRVAFLSDVAPWRSSLLPEVSAFADDI